MQTANRLNGGEIDIRLTHPNLYWLVMTLALIALLLGGNFIGGTLTTKYPSPTFPIFDAPNALWGVIFLALSVSEFISLNVYRRLRLVRFLIICSMAYCGVLTYGTTQPFGEGTGSLQLPILYGGLCLIQIPIILEPFVNPWTAKR